MSKSRENIRVLIAHSRYQQRGGEDVVVDAEAAMLRRRGHQVELFMRHNDDLRSMPRFRIALRTLWSAESAEEFRKRISVFEPDVVHVHNTFPLLSPALYWAAASAKIPVVQTLHNFRLLCPQAMFLRNGKVCEDCLGRLPVPGALRGCYRGSVAQSTVVASMIGLHRAIGTYSRKVTRYIALNEFCRRKFIEAGFPPGRVVTKPNFVDMPEVPKLPRSGFLYVGRLSAEKGISVLARAIAQAGVRGRVAGTGPEAPLLHTLHGATLLGALSSEEVYREMAGAVALVLPSIWYENFPRTLVEAFACGLPVIASRIGALADLVEDGTTGLLFEAGNAKDLTLKMGWAMDHPAEMAEMGRNARRKYEAEFTPERNYAQLIAIYDDAIRDSQVAS